MKENNQASDDPRISALLRQARLAPDLPPRFPQQVWRRIENAAAPATSASWLDAVVNLLLRPKLALAAVALVLLMGGLAGTLEGRQAARHDAQMHYLASVAPAALR